MAMAHISGTPVEELGAVLGLAAGATAARDRKRARTKHRASPPTSAVEVVIPALTSPPWRACNPEEPLRAETTDDDGTGLVTAGPIAYPRTYFYVDNGMPMTEMSRRLARWVYLAALGLKEFYEATAIEVNMTVNMVMVMRMFFFDGGLVRSTCRNTGVEGQVTAADQVDPNLPPITNVVSKVVGMNIYANSRANICMLAFPNASAIGLGFRLITTLSTRIGTSTGHRGSSEA